jgi:hypothetical protein
MHDALTARLAHLAAQNQTTHYGALARDLNLTGPATIARLTAELERLMEEDAAQNRPLRAALVTARGTTLPAPGFFVKATTLGLIITNQTAFLTQQRHALYNLYALHAGTTTPRGARGV